MGGTQTAGSLYAGFACLGGAGFFFALLGAVANSGCGKRSTANCADTRQTIDRILGKTKSSGKSGANERSGRHAAFACSSTDNICISAGDSKRNGTIQRRSAIKFIRHRMPPSVPSVRGNDPKVADGIDCAGSGNDIALVVEFDLGAAVSGSLEAEQRGQVVVLVENDFHVCK